MKQLALFSVFCFCLLAACNNHNPEKEAIIKAYFNGWEKKNWNLVEQQLAPSFNTMGIDLGKVSVSRAKDYKGTYYGKPSDGENLAAQVYSGGVFIEIIQPLAGTSVFRDFPDNNPAGGVQHVAHRTPVDNLDKVINGFAEKGLSVVSSWDTSIAQIVFFDTCKELGVMTEIMGITKDGVLMIEKMKQ